MILVRKILLLITVLVALAFIVISGLYCYFSIANINSLPVHEQKIIGENILFLSIITSSVILVLILFLFLRSQAIFSELNKIGMLVRKGNFSPRESFNRLGPIGQRIQKIYIELEELNEAKSKRISSLNSILSFFLNNTEMKVIIIDITGNIENVSTSFLKSQILAENFSQGKNIEEALKDLPFQDILLKLEDKRSVIREKINKETYSFIPIFNKNNEISLITCVLGEKEIAAGVTALQVKEKTRQLSRMTNFIRSRLPGSRKKGG